MTTQEESFVIIGTKQPDLEDVKKKDLNNYLPLWKQEVRDEKGRKRLHGAFKGGFSAGYFNTVGSKEGWTPTQFVSSRTNRQKVSYRPEDFMDEEDLEDFNESKKLQATSNYDVRAGQEELMARKQAILNSEENKNSIFGGLTEKILDDIIIPNTEPIGIKLLKSMGWREGQGIGARVHRKDKDDIYAEKYLFAPKDVAMVSFEQKANLFGLGFDPYKNAPEFRDNYYTQINKKPSEDNKKKTLGFGVGIFEEDDDEDIYNTNSMDNFDSIIDDTMDDYEEKIVLGGNQTTKKRKSNSYYNDYDREELNNSIKDRLQMCSDGTYPISGFVVSSTIENIGKWFNPPVVPKNFIPYHKFKDSDHQTNNQYNQQLNETTRVSLTADQRRDILGEEKLKGPPTNSTFMSSLSNTDQYKLQHLIDDITRKRTEESKTIQVEIPDLKKEVALAALKGFMPFQAMPSKQERYKRFLQVKAGLEKEYMEFPEIYTNKEKNLEYQEFAKAAQIYQPLSNAMASRFTSASNSKDSTKGTGNKKEEEKEKEKIVTIVRTVEDWQPSRLLCKRFNIPNPHKNKDMLDVSSDARNNNLVEDILDERTMNRLIQERDRDYGSKKRASIIERGEEREREREKEKNNLISNRTTSTTTMTKEMNSLKPYAEDEPPSPNDEEKKELLKKERPSMDLFNSIFNDSDEDDDEEDEEDDKEDNDNSKLKLKLPSNTEIITSATSGSKINPLMNESTATPIKDSNTIKGGNGSSSSNGHDNTMNTLTIDSKINNSTSKIKDIGEAFQIIKTMKEKKSKKKKKKRSSSSKGGGGSKHSKHDHDTTKRKKKRKYHHSSSSSSSDNDDDDNSDDSNSDSDDNNNKSKSKSKSKNNTNNNKRKRRHHHHHHRKSKSSHHRRHRSSHGDSSISSDSDSDSNSDSNSNSSSNEEGSDRIEWVEKSYDNTKAQQQQQQQPLASSSPPPPPSSHTNPSRKSKRSRPSAAEFI